MTSIYTKKTMKNSYSLPIQSSSLLYYIGRGEVFLVANIKRSLGTFALSG